MYHELRTYEIAPGRGNPAIRRIVDHGVNFLAKHGIRPVVYLEPVIGTSPQLVYLLKWESLRDRDERWEAYVNDPGWVQARLESERDGPIVTRTTNVMLREVEPIMARLHELGLIEP